MSEPKYNRVLISSDDETTSRVLLGASVGNLNEGIVTDQQGLLVPNPVPMTLPALTVAVYYFNELVSPTPPILWELSCGANVATIDQSGVITRQSNPNAQSFDSNGAVSTGQIGGLIQVSGTVLRGDGSKSGVVGYFNITIQNSAARQYDATHYLGVDVRGRAGANSPIAAGFYNLVE